MSLIARLSQPVTVRTISDGAVDDYGVPTDVVTATTEMDLAIQQTDAVEITVGEQTVISEWVAYGDDPALALTARDQIVDAAGTVFEVVGRPYRPRTPRGAHHLEARLRVIE